MYQNCPNCSHEYFVETGCAKYNQSGVRISKTGKTDHRMAGYREIAGDIIPVCQDTGRGEDNYLEVFQCEHCSSNFQLGPDGNLIPHAIEEQQTAKSVNNYWQPKNIDETEISGPFECPQCGFHIGVDYTYLEQINNIVSCPVCGIKAKVLEKDQEGLSGKRLVWTSP